MLSFRHELGQIEIWENPFLWVWRIEYKKPSRTDLPTIYSENYSLGLGLLTSTLANISGYASAFWPNIGAVCPGNTKHKVFLQKTTFFIGGTGMNVDLSNTWNAALQILSESAHYEVAAIVRALNHQQNILLIGLRHAICSISFSLEFTEDIDYCSSEDVRILISWQSSG